MMTREAFVDSVDQDQTAKKVQSDLLIISKLFLHLSNLIKMAESSFKWVENIRKGLTTLIKIY